MIIGYARVSTEDQHLDLQLQALKKFGCDRIFEDFGVSGATTKRPGLDRVLHRLRAGDTLVVWRLDRLGRSLPHLVKLLETLGRRGIVFHSLNEHIDTASSGGRLLFHVMAALAEFERSLISERTRAGMAAAQASGKAIGRPRVLGEREMEAAVALLEDGWSKTEVAAHFGVHVRTLQRRIGQSLTADAA